MKTKKILYISIALIGIITLLGIFNFQTKRLEGTILNINSEERIITVNNKKGDFRILLNDQTKLLDENGTPTFLSYYQRDFKVITYGKYIASNTFIPTRIRILKMPNIILITPEPYSDIAQDFVITGKARVFENTFNIKIVDYVSKEVLLEDIIMADALDIGQYGDFTKTIHLPDYNRQSIYVTLYDASAKDGSIQDAIGFELYLRGSHTKGTKKVQVFFNNTNLDPEISCNKVFPVIRTVEDSPAIATMAIEELLKGLTGDEERQGYNNSIPVNVKLNKINIKDGTAFVDFNEELEKGVGGSCRVTSIRAQITETLKQFSSVQNVTISINGRTEDILQP
jgi:hypothetical protein